MHETQPVVAVINTSVEIVELLQETLTDEGYTVVPAFTFEFKRGERDFRAFVSIPYVENWEYFRDNILELGILPKRCFICSTVNKTALEVLVGPTSTLELIGRPFDLEVIVDKVRRAIEAPSDE
jgi:hypothetical protein